MLYPQYFIDDLKNRSAIGRVVAVLTLMVVFFDQGVGQVKPVLIDEFARISNDGLMTHVDYFWNQLEQKNSTGFVLLYGTALEKHINQRRIEGCNYWRKHPTNTLKYIFEADAGLKVQFWSVPTPTDDPRFQEVLQNYELPGLNKPVELSNSAATDEYCPRLFDLEWYSKFMVANPVFLGKVVIDTSKRDFVKRVGKYRKQLVDLGVKTFRVRFFRHHFYHESDEQWWLIPQARK